MHKSIKKIVSILTIFMLVGMNFISTAVYAAEEIVQSADTKEDNVKLNASINGAYSADLKTGDEANLELFAGVENAGYLKDIKVTIENKNYSLEQVEDDNVIWISENEIQLNEVDTDKAINVKIPMKFNKLETVDEQDLNGESTVKFNAVYVNDRGREKNIEKELNLKVDWKLQGTEEVSQKLIRYIKYENKTLVSFEIKEGIKENSVPVKNKEISIVVPKINNQAPEKAIVNGQDIGYKYENGTITIHKEVKANEDGKYNWNSQDTYVVTYVYGTQSDVNSIQEDVNAKVVTIKNDVLEGFDVGNSFSTENEVGSLVEVKSNGISEINKGFMYTSSKRENDQIDTRYSQSYEINVGYADVVDSVVVKETESKFTDADKNNIKDATESVTTTKVSISQEELASVFGEDGTLVIRNENGDEIAKLNKDNLEQNIDAKRITIEASKPQKEGIVNVRVEKAIKGVNSKEEVQSFKKLITKVEGKSFIESEEISSTTIDNEINLTEPTSKASVSISTDRLSTVVKNENVVFNVVLSKKDITDTLYTNPSIKLTLPEEVKEANIKSAKVLYDEEITAGSLAVNGREIEIKLEGNQTQYNTSTVADGTLIVIETDLSIDNLVPSSKGMVTLEYTNEFTGEVGKAEKEIDIVAPTGFVTTNAVSIDGTTETAVESDAKLIKVATQDAEKTMNITANLVNNLGYDANGFTVVGRIPFTGNKTVGGEDLQTNINTVLASRVELSGIDDWKVYYSRNIDEAVDGNGWTEEFTSEAKSFKIVKQSSFEDKKGATFSYSVNVPANLDYDMQAKTSYGIFYNNDAQDGVNKNLVESKVVGITTGVAPEIKAEISAIDTNTGYAIDNNGSVAEGEYVTYRVKLSNTGSTDAHDVKAKVNLPEQIALVKYVEGDAQTTQGYVIDKETKSVEKEAETLKGGESIEFEFQTMIDQVISSNVQELENGEKVGIDNDGNLVDLNEVTKITVDFEVEADILEDNLTSKYNVKNTEGSLSTKLSQLAYTDLDETQEIVYKAMVSNVNYEDKNNVTVRFNLPKGIEFTEVLTGQQVNYDKGSNIVTANLGKLDGLKTRYVTIKAKKTGAENATLKTKAVVTADGINEEIESNTVELVSEVTNDVIRATQTTNIQNNITDNDNLEFYIDIENNSQSEQTLILEDNIGQELRVNKYTITIDGNKVYEGETNYISNTINIPSGKTAKITIIATPYAREEGDTINIVNKPTITTIGGENVSVNEVELTLLGTEVATSDDTVEQGYRENSEVEEQERIYRISGTVWFDENRDGKKDYTEQRLSGVELQLYDSKAKRQVATTSANENGEYIFSGVKAGEYIVVASFDNTKYEVASYKVDGAESSENSDFVSTELNGNEVAATDVIKVTETSSYNVDLGLMKKEIFDLHISKNISKVTVVSSNNGAREYNYNENNPVVELTSNEVQDATVLIEYNIKVTNNGDIAGYAKSIVDYLPSGMIFNSELNQDWYLAKNGNLYTVSLANTKIEPGESKEVKLVLTKKMNGSNTGIVRGKAEIETTYNEKGVAEINALSANSTNGENNIATSDVIILKKSKVKAFATIGITIGLTAIIGLLIFEVKKYVDKRYSIDM